MKKACNRSWLVNLRLPPSGLVHVQAQNGSRPIGVNPLSTCPPCTKIGGIRDCRDKSEKLIS